MTEEILHLSKDALVKRYLKEHSLELREKIVASYAPLIQYIVRRFSYSREEYDDLSQVGTIGLIRSLERFDPSKDVDFATFATPNIIGEIKHYFRDKQKILKVPRKLQELHSKIKKIIRLQNVAGKSPTVKELSELLEVKEEKIVEALEAKVYSSVLSLDSPPKNVKSTTRFGDNSSTLLETLAVENKEDFFIDRVTLRDALAKLAKRSQRLLYLRYFRGLSQAEIAEEMNLSQMHISRLLSSSIEKLKKNFGK